MEGPVPQRGEDSLAGSEPGLAGSEDEDPPASPHAREPLDPLLLREGRQVLSGRGVADPAKLRRTRKVLKSSERRKARWYKARRNTNLYMTGLPPDATQDELRLFCERAGALRPDPATGEPRVKIYRDAEDGLKGDALVSFAAPESVDLALQFLQNEPLRPGWPLRLELATFEQRGEYVPRRAQALDGVARARLKAARQRLFGWGEEPGEGLRIVVLRNLFGAEDYDPAEKEAFFAALESDVSPELARIGAVRKLTFYRDSPDGVAQVKFERASSAEQCVSLMRGRYYNGRVLDCFYHDGKTNYKAGGEDPAETLRRIEDFGRWLEAQIDADRL